MSTIKLTIAELKKWVQEGKSFKIRVNPETSRLVQESVFACGRTWFDGSKEVSRLSANFLFFDEDLTLTKTEEDELFFISELLPEIELILNPTLTALGCLPVIKPSAPTKDCKGKIKKPKIKINGIELIAPEKQAPEIDTIYYVATLGATVNKRYWQNSTEDFARLKDGRVFLTAQDCTAMRNALIGLLTGETNGGV